MMQGEDIEMNNELEEAASMIGTVNKEIPIPMSQKVEQVKEEWMSGYSSENETHEVMKEEPSDKNKSNLRSLLKMKVNNENDYSSSDDEDGEDCSDTEYNNIKNELNDNKSPVKREFKLARQELPCDICALIFRNQYLLDRHKLMKHAISMLCGECGQSFDNFKILKSHLQDIHKKERKEKARKEREIRRREESLGRKPVIKTADSCPCPHCGIVLGSTLGLNAHIARLHADNEPEQCSKCDYRTQISSEMQIHFKKMHTIEMVATCEFCGDVFKNIKRHLRRTQCGRDSKEERERVQCEQGCPKTFPTVAKMREHVRKIHGERNIMCTQCSYKTYSSFNLKLHVSKMHNGINMVKEPCPYCDKTSTNIPYHIKIYHGDKEDISQI